MQTIFLLKYKKYRARILKDGEVYTVSCFREEDDGQIIYFQTFHKTYKTPKNAIKQADKFFAWAVS